MDSTWFVNAWDRGASARIAKKVCRRCPVRAECLAYAVEVKVELGVWGGMTPTQRRRLGSTPSAQSASQRV
jgi:WhiB family redox-sensing transcriptional regulator